MPAAEPSSTSCHDAAAVGFLDTASCGPNCCKDYHPAEAAMATASISSGIVRQITPGLVRLQLRPRSTSHMTSTAACATFLWEPRASLCPLAARLRTPPKRVKRALPSVTNAASNGAGSLLSKEEVGTTQLQLPFASITLFARLMHDWNV